MQYTLKKANAVNVINNNVTTKLTVGTETKIGIISDINIWNSTVTITVDDKHDFIPSKLIQIDTYNLPEIIFDSVDSNISVIEDKNDFYTGFISSSGDCIEIGSKIRVFKRMAQAKYSIILGKVTNAFIDSQRSTVQLTIRSKDKDFYLDFNRIGDSNSYKCDSFIELVEE